MKTISVIGYVPRALISVIVFYLALPLLAQPTNTLVVPNAYANTEGERGQQLPF
jgi:hypothetical protein